MQSSQTPKLIYLLSPRYWLLWLIAGIAWLLIHLPYRWLIKLGGCLGKMAVRFPSRMRHIANTNLRLCFPELNSNTKQALLRESFIAAGIGIFETLLGWWAPHQKLESLLTIRGDAAITAALQQGKSVLICTAHFTSLELVGRLLGSKLPIALMYKPQKNPLIEWLNHHALNKHYQKAIPRNNIREMLRCLSNNMAICYTVDVDAGAKNSLFIPFFGIPAASVTATSRLAKTTGAILVPAIFYRRQDNSGYDLIFEPPLENFPSNNLTYDLLRINQMIEKAICQRPEQYIWQYKRFKTRPDGESDLYVE